MKKIECAIKNDGIHWDTTKACSYGSLINWFILIGTRGTGKTTNVMRQAISDYNKGLGGFIYIKRYKPDIELSAKKLCKKYNRNIKVKQMKNSSFAYEYDKETIGYAIPLSVTGSYKSTDFVDDSGKPNIANIIFDEAILKRGSKQQYIKDEMGVLLEFVSTVMRERVNYRVWIMANNMDITNPIFRYFNIQQFEGQIFIDKTRGVYVENILPTDKLSDIQKETPLYRLTNGTTYGDYHYKNKPLITTHKRIGVKSGRDKLMFRLGFNDYTLNVYLRDEELGYYVEVRNKVINDNMTYRIMSNGKINYFYVKLFKEDKQPKIFLKLYADEDIVYENEIAIQLIEDFVEIIK